MFKKMVQIAQKLYKHDFIRYGFVGAASTALDYLVLNFSFHLLGGKDSTLWLATCLGFVVGAINGYILNSRWTFSYDTKGQETKKFIQFLIVSLIGLLFTEIIVLGLFKIFGIDKNISKGVAVVMVFFWNYFANKFWTFKK